MLPPEAIKAIAICGVFVFAVLGCIIVALLEHQRKMAELMRADRQQGNGLDERVDALQGEIRELKALLVNQALSLQTQAPKVTPEDIQQRVS
jgi:hypothetical protein